AATGEYKLSAPPGTYTLRARAESWEHEDDFEWRPGRDAAQVSADGFALTGDRRQDLRLPLVPFPVRVLDPSGQPVAQAWIESASDGTADTTGQLFPGAATRGSFSSNRWTDSSGVATLQVLPGVPFTASVDPPGDRGLPAVAHISGTATGADVHLEDGATLQGRLRAPDSSPESANHGWLVPDSGPRRAITLGPDGAYAITAVPGRYRIELDTEDDFSRPSDDEASWSLVSSAFDLDDDTTFDLTIADRGATVRAVGEDGYDLIGDFDSRASGASIEDFELAPGFTASSTFSLFGPGSSNSLSLPVLAPSRATTSFETDIGGVGFDVSLPRLYVAPGEDTVVAVVAGAVRFLSRHPEGLLVTNHADGSATVTWNPPTDDGGSPVTGYLVSAVANEPGGKQTRTRTFVKAPATSGTFSGLTLGREYRFAVASITARGVGGEANTRWTLISASNPGPQDPMLPEPPAQDPPAAGNADTPQPARPGYWMLGANGQIHIFGEAAELGSPMGTLGAARAVDVEPTPTGAGYWILDDAGRVTAHGDALAGLGPVDRSRLASGEKPTSLSATPSGQGFWIFTTRGRALAFGDATFLGDVSAITLNGPVLDSVATPSGQGYFMVAADGGIFTFGDATFAGSMGGQKLNAPVQSLVPDGDGAGYWLVAADGGVFSFDAPFKGSLGSVRLNRPVTGMVRYGDGYLMVGEDGGIFNFSNLAFSGSLGADPPDHRIVSVAAIR
ncbi:MAG: fibronectin type III domain-containing protein, partial [Acidimicrobiia bacterium]